MTPKGTGRGRPGDLPPIDSVSLARKGFEHEESASVQVESLAARTLDLNQLESLEVDLPAVLPNTKGVESEGSRVRILK